jgi:hypothetical protein
MFLASSSPKFKEYIPGTHHFLPPFSLEIPDFSYAIAVLSRLVHASVQLP